MSKRSDCRQWTKGKVRGTAHDARPGWMEGAADRMLAADRARDERPPPMRSDTPPHDPIDFPTPPPDAALFGPSLAARLSFDGSCWPNPGPASCAYILRLDDGTEERRRIDLGHGTNNVAEYAGLIHGMVAALSRGVTRLEVRGDSRLVIDGVRKAKFRAANKPHLEALKSIAVGHVRRFRDGVDLIWVPRDLNAEADALAG